MKIERVFIVVLFIWVAVIHQNLNGMGRETADAIRALNQINRLRNDVEKEIISTIKVISGMQR